MSAATTRTTLVMGGSGYLGSHVVRALLGRGDRVRVWVRESSSTAAFDDLDVDVVRGELDDAAALAAAMKDVDAVHYCIVDTRAWLRDPAPLYRTNVELLAHVLDAAVAGSVPRFVFCSTVGTIGIVGEGLADEETPHDWTRLGGPYIDARLQAERLVLSHARERGLPAVVLNVATTYGGLDHGPTPHGRMIRSIARGKVKAYVAGASMEAVGVEDAARAFVLAEERGRVGERYIISERFLPIGELFAVAAEEAGVPAPSIGIPLPAMRVLGVLGAAMGRLSGKDAVLTPTSVRLMHIQSPLDHGKAVRELGWEPGSAVDAVRDGVRFFLGQRPATG